MMSSSTLISYYVSPVLPTLVPSHYRCGTGRQTFGRESVRSVTFCACELMYSCGVSMQDHFNDVELNIH